MKKSIEAFFILLLIILVNNLISGQSRKELENMHVAMLLRLRTQYQETKTLPTDAEWMTLMFYTFILSKNNQYTPEEMQAAGINAAMSYRTIQQIINRKL